VESPIVVVEGEDTVKATACDPCRSATRRIAPPVRSRASSQPIGSQPGSGSPFGRVRWSGCVSLSPDDRRVPRGAEPGWRVRSDLTRSRDRYYSWLLIFWKSLAAPSAKALTHTSLGSASPLKPRSSQKLPQSPGSILCSGPFYRPARVRARGGIVCCRPPEPAPVRGVTIGRQSDVKAGEGPN
jgi:hypothetical protein